jgi:transposase
VAGPVSGGRDRGVEGQAGAGAAGELDGRQIARLYALIVGNDPRQLQFDFALWTREMVRQVIRAEFKVALSVVSVVSVVSVGRLLKKMGLSPQRPLHRAYEQDPDAVERWKTETYPAIRAEAEEAGATIYFGDEAGIRLDYHAGTTWAPVGRTPVVHGTRRGFRST